MQTFKKLPIANPKATTNASTIPKLYPEGPLLWCQRSALRAFAGSKIQVINRSVVFGQEVRRSGGQVLTGLLER